jgi:hypothetical protein
MGVLNTHRTSTCGGCGNVLESLISVPETGGVCTWQISDGGGSGEYGTVSLHEAEDPPPTCNPSDPETGEGTGSVLAVVGYDTTPNPMIGSPLALAVPIPPTMCASGCTIAITGSVRPGGGIAPIGGGNAPGICQTSPTPGSTGYYAVMCFLNYSSPGTTCTASSTVPDPATSLAQAPPACQGATGTVNGATRCLPQAGTGQPSTPVAPVTSGDPPVTQIPTSASDVHTPQADGGGRSGGGGIPSPAGGVVPSGGGAPGGAARGINTATPEGQVFNNTQNTAGGATGGGGANVDLSVEMCGLPGTPACKIDETGTPTDASLAAAHSAFDAASALREAQIAGAGNVTSLGLTFAIDIPAGSCADPTLTLPGRTPFVAQLCEKAPVIRDVMGWLFGILAAIYLYKSLTQRVGAKGS